MNNKTVIMIGIIAAACILVLVAGCNTVSTKTPDSSSTQDKPTISTPTSSNSKTPSITDTLTPNMSTPSGSVPAQTSTPVINPNIIIDHTNWDWYESQGPGIFENVAALRIFFAHASVGANILEGMKTLNSIDSVRYPLLQENSGGSPPAETREGVMYEYPRGNPGWVAKVRDFATYIQNGWNTPMADVVMNKFCYIDQEADWKVYRDSMLTLESQYLGTRFVYWTMPITTSSASDALLRSKFNQNIRGWIESQRGKILYDIADIEAWSPEGQQQVFSSQGQVCQQLYSAYSSDGGHLSEKGAQRAAIGLYSLFGKSGGIK